MPNKILELLEKHFHSKKGLFIGLVAIVFAEAAIYSLFNGLTAIISKTYSNTILYAFFGLLLLMYSFIWYSSNTFPYFKNKHKATVVLSFLTENDHQKILFFKDIVEKVDTLICNHSLQNLIKIVIPKEHQVKKVNNILKEYLEKKNMKYSKKYNRLVNQNSYSVFIYGELIQRNDEQEKYFIDYSILAKHSEIDKPTQAELSKEMRILFPAIVKMPVTEEYKFITVTKDMLYLSIRYITGVILYLSPDSDNMLTAYKIHKGLLEEMKRLTPQYDLIITQLKIIHGVELYDLACNECSTGNVKDALEHSDKACELAPDIYELMMLNGYLHFEVSRNTGKAINMFIKAGTHKKNDPAWQYNLAFMYMYARNFEEAIKSYDYLFSKTLQDEEKIIKDCIEYDVILYNKEPEKPEILFIIGYLNYRKLQCMPLALECFEKFIEEAGGKRHYGPLTKRARKYLSTIKSKMKIEKVS